MNIVQSFMSFFRSKAPVAPTIMTDFSDPSFDINAYMAPFEARLADHFVKAELDSKKFLAHYGDFTDFLYRPGFDHFLRKEVLFFWDPSGEYLAFLDTDHWQEKHPFNFPGPFYSGESDTCGTGVCQAPSNVMNDEHCCEYVFKQPTTYYEFLCVVDAAAVEVFDSFSSNGNDYWTVQECRTWWRNREHLLSSLANEELIKMNNGQAQLYIDYLNGEAEMDLRRYCYFLENGVYPTNSSTILPEL